MLTVKTFYYILNFYTLRMPLKLIIPVLIVCGFIGQYFLAGKGRGRGRPMIAHMTMIIFAEVASYIVSLTDLGPQVNYVILSIIMLNACLLIGSIVAEIVWQKLNAQSKTT